jgi:hypothetical protein
MNTAFIASPPAADCGYWPSPEELALVLSQTADWDTSTDEAPHATTEPTETETPW